MSQISESWKARIRKLPPRLSLKEAVRRMGAKYDIGRHWLIRHKYKAADGRAYAWTPELRASRRKIDPEKIDWSKPNIQIARESGLSRERIRQLRKIHGN